jgi:branched-chain amino acid transport system permease protein
LAILILSMLICAALGIVIEKLAYRPLRNKPKLAVLITAIGVSLLIEYVGQHPRVFGASPRTFPEVLRAKNLEFGGLVVSSNEVIVLGLTLFLLLALRFIVLNTRMGTAMRALSFNASAAALMGINIDVVISFTFGLGSALAAAGGILYAMKYPAIDPLMGIMPGLKAFTAAVLGGIGNLPGAALGGLIIGVLETFVGGSHWSNYRDAIAFAILILILLFKPSGLLGTSEAEKV